jgi:hypothetical protein
MAHIAAWFGGAHVGAPGSGATTYAAIVNNTPQHDVIADHIVKVGAFDVRTRPLMQLLSAYSDYDDLAAYGELLMPVVVRIRGPSAFCEATPCRVSHYMAVAPPLAASIAVVDAAVDNYLQTREVVQNKPYSCVNIDRDSARGDANVHAPLAATAVRLATRIALASRAEFSDSSARRAAKLEFQTAVAAIAKWAMSSI